MIVDVTGPTDPQTTAARTKLAAELESVRRESRIINLCVWGVALGVMIYGAGNTYGLLAGHQVPAGIAWLLSPMVDSGLCVGLVATRGLTRYNIKAGWVGSLRWITALMTWGLNIAAPLTHLGGPDWLGVFIHSVGPVLLLVVVEAAAHYQHQIGKVIAGKQGRLDDAVTQVRSEQAERADLARQVEQLRVANATVTERADQLAEHIAAINAERDTERASALRAVHLAEQETERVAVAAKEQAERLRTDHAERLAALRSEQAERAGRSTPGRARQNGRTAGQGTRSTASESKTNAPKLTDDEAIAAMLRAHRSADYEWTSREVHRITGAGFGRIPRLLAAITDHHADGGSRSTSAEHSDPEDQEVDHDDRLAAFAGA